MPLVSRPLSASVQPAASDAAQFSIVHAAENIWGGVGTYLRDLLALQRKTFGRGAVTAVVPASQRDILQSPAGVNIVTFDDCAGRGANALRLARRVRELVAASAPQIVHVHSTYAGAVLRPALLLQRTQAKLVYCPHGWAFDRDGSHFAKAGARWVERGLAALSHRIICISEYEMQAALRCGIAARKLVLVRNGVPENAPRPSIAPASIDWPSGLRRILFVGRFDRQKGVDILLQALAQLSGKAFACLVGETVLGDAAFKTIPHNARLCGWLSPAQLEAYYRSADVLVIPSRWEGFGLTAAEAMRAGLPVIASNVGGLQEIVADGVTGLLIAPNSVACWPWGKLAAAGSYSITRWSDCIGSCAIFIARHGSEQ
jgi:glycosyltransferase involved in cell wall biosynthesis